METFEKKLQSINAEWAKEYSRIRLASALNVSGELLDFLDRTKIVFVDDRHKKKDFIYFELNEEVKAVSYNYKTGNFSIYTDAKRVLNQAKEGKEEFPKNGETWKNYFSLTEAEAAKDEKFLHDLFDLLMEKSDELLETIMLSKYTAIAKEQNTRKLNLLCELEHGSVEVYLEIDDTRLYLGEAADILDELA